MVGHFVYVTTDHESGKFYIGKHTTKNQNDSYVGSGVWVQNCKKAGVKLQKQIIAKCQSEDDAYAFEEKMVAAFRKKYPKLCMNFVDGGKGSIRQNMIGRKSGMLGKKHSEETLKKLSELGKVNRVGEKHHMYGKKHSEQSKKKMSESHKRIAHLRGRKVLCVESGVIYKSLAEAAMTVSGNVNSRNNIRSCCQGKIKSSCGYTWAFI